jgi:uncharacterized membrane protein
VLSAQIELRRLGTRHGPHPARHAVAAEEQEKPPTLVERLAARIDALPPSVKPAAFGASIIVIYAMARGARYILPVIVVIVLATSPDPWSSLMTGVGAALLAMIGGALSGFAYSLFGRRLRTAIPGGYYLTGMVTLAPYMIVLTYMARLAHGGQLWRSPDGGDLAVAGFMTLVFGLTLGRAWFREDPTGESHEQTT